MNAGAHGTAAAVAAVIPSWNTERYLERCVLALREQDGVTIELLVVDNGSQDESLALAKRTRMTLGFAKAERRRKRVRTCNRPTASATRKLFCRTHRKHEEPLGATRRTSILMMHLLWSAWRGLSRPL